MSIVIAGFLVGAGIFFGLDTLGTHLNNALIRSVREWKALRQAGK